MQPMHPVFFESDKTKGAAILTEVSYSGARLQLQTELPARGDSVRIYVWPPNHAEPFELMGHVVSLYDDAFGIEYEEPGQEICQWIDALEAADAAGRSGPGV